MIKAVLRSNLQRYKFSKYRAQQRKCDVRIASNACIRGTENIELGQGTSIEASATLCAGNFIAEGEFKINGIGRIVLGQKCSVRRGSILQTYGGRIEIGDNVSINPYTLISGYGGVSIGSQTRIASHVSIIASNHIFCDPQTPIMHQGCDGKGISIGNDVWVGTGARILDGIRINDGAVIGAGAVVTKDVPPRTVVVGVPSRKVSERKNQS